MATLGKRAREEDYQLTTTLRLLPAAQFLWFTDVPIKKRLKFEKILVKLMKLFVTPHVTNVYPYLECSYSKKYETLQRTMPSCFDDIINFMRLENKSIEHSRGAFQVFKALLNDTYRFEEKFLQAVKSWYENTASKPMLFVSINLISGDTGHAVFIVLKKYVDQVKFFYFDPHGYDESSLATNILIRLLSTQLTTLLTIPVREVVSTCPTLQLSGHGGNCLQWFLLIFALLIINEDWFDNPILFLNKVAEHGTLNIMLFSLACFLRFIHVFGLQQYYFVLLRQQSYVESLNKCDKEDKIYRELLTSTLDIPNCNDLEVNFCPVPCTLCENKCRYKVSVQTTEGKPCKLLNPKEIAYKMFRLYFKLQTLSSHQNDIYSFNKSHMSDMKVHLQLPETLEDFRHVLPEEKYQKLRAQLEFLITKTKMLQDLKERLKELDFETIQRILTYHRIVIETELKKKQTLDHIMFNLTDIFTLQSRLEIEDKKDAFMGDIGSLSRKIEYTQTLIEPLMKILITREQSLLRNYMEKMKHLQSSIHNNEEDRYFLNVFLKECKMKKTQKYFGLHTTPLLGMKDRLEEIENNLNTLDRLFKRIQRIQHAAKSSLKLTEDDKMNINDLPEIFERLKSKRGTVLYKPFAQMLDQKLNRLQDSLED